MNTFKKVYGVNCYDIGSMLMGRWSSDAFIHYIRKKVEQFSYDPK